MRRWTVVMEVLWLSVSLISCAESKTRTDRDVEDSGQRSSYADVYVGKGRVTGAEGVTECECEDGRYFVAYRMVDGNCEGTTFYTIPIEYRYSQIGKWELNEVYQAIYTQTTQISYHGCQMSIVYQVKNRDNLIFHIQGQLDVEDTTRLSGRVLRTEFNDNQSLKCQGTYDLELTKTAELEVD